MAHAEKMEFPQYVALAAERAGQFLVSKGKRDLARVYIQKSLYAYSNWGAEGKVKQMRQVYADLLPNTKRTVGHHSATITSSNTLISTASIHTSNSGGGDLDILSVMKASQAISEEIKLDLLLKKMILVLMENAGAERALLIQDRGDELMVAAEAYADRDEVDIMRALPLSKEDKDKVALSVIRNVYRTQDTVVSSNVKKDTRFAMDPYIQQNKVKSLLCMPIMHQGKVRIVIYMEHSQLSGAFTSDRINVLNMLSSQVAISIENSVLYDTMEQKVEARTQELQNANQELQHKNSRITDSINYARTMQHAILPTEAELFQVSNDFFVIYMPKDIVSGDFYWFANIQNKFVLAAIDCTGHGVPGAFMSMIGNTLLDELVNQKEILDPAEILEGLDRGVRISLSQETSNNTDGMDLLCCVMERKDDGSMHILMAGAKNPLYYIKDGELGKVDADRRGIGGFGYKSSKNPFITKELTLSKGDAFYLTTDGFIDAGGEDRKPFSKKRFADTIIELWEMPMEEQRKIFVERLIAHQGNTQQRDDITVLGFRV